MTERNIDAIRAQMKRMGWSIDWDARGLDARARVLPLDAVALPPASSSAGLAYRKEAPVKWCPNDQTVLANEQVIDGRCERCGAEVEARNLEQWFFKITDYADALLDEMALLESWPERVLTMQRNWIGRSEGAEILFRVEELDEDVPVFTTRPDTLFGATFFVLAPEHPLVDALVAGTEHERRGARLRAPRGRREERSSASEKEKNGVFTGRYVVNPVNDERIPIWVADYVLMDYGTGAIMAVPAHDERDFAFAEQLRPADRAGRRAGRRARSSAGAARSSRTPRTRCSSTRASSPACRRPRRSARSSTWLEAQRPRPAPTINYRLRDWLLSRQRYWGCPIPIVHCDRCGIVPVPDDELPVLLPEVDDYLPKGRSPLAAAEDWVQHDLPVVRRRGEARDRHDGHVRRLVLVLPPLHRPAQRRGAVRPRRSSTTGCRSTSTSAGSSTRSCT